MAEVYGIDNAGAAALAAATAKTVLEVSSSSVVTGRVVDLSVGCDMTVSGTLKVELISFTTTGTGTAYTPKKVNGESQNRAANVTAKINDTVEPGTVTVLKTWSPIACPGGPFEIQLPLGREFYLPTSTNYGIRLTASAACNGFANLQIEE